MLYFLTGIAKTTVFVIYFQHVRMYVLQSFIKTGYGDNREKDAGEVING